MDFKQRCVEAVLDHPDAPNDVWAFGIVRREVNLAPGAWTYIDGFNRVRRLRVRLDAPSGWIQAFAARWGCSDQEVLVAEQVGRIVDSFDLPRRVPAPLVSVEPHSLAGRVALVTGASRGIGAAVARRLAAAGATVVCVARTLEGHPAQTDEAVDTTLADTLAAIAAQGGNAEPMLADLSNPDDAKALVSRVIDQFDHLDVVVNNAARGMYRPLERWTTTETQKLFQVNVLSPFAVIQSVIPHMRDREFGAIVNVSSIVADKPIGPPYGLFERRSFTTVYGMAKAALDRLSSGAAIECCDLGVQINSLSPSGGVRTPGALAASEMYNRFPELAEPPETMAEAVLALCEPRTPQLTGRILTSGSLLADLGRSVCALDGGAFIDADAVVDLRHAPPSAIYLDEDREAARR